LKKVLDSRFLILVTRCEKRSTKFLKKWIFALLPMAWHSHYPPALPLGPLGDGLRHMAYAILTEMRSACSGQEENKNCLSLQRFLAAGVFRKFSRIKSCFDLNNDLASSIKNLAMIFNIDFSRILL